MPEATERKQQKSVEEIIDAINSFVIKDYESMKEGLCSIADEFERKKEKSKKLEERLTSLLLTENYMEYLHDCYEEIDLEYLFGLCRWLDRKLFDKYYDEKGFESDPPEGTIDSIALDITEVGFRLLEPYVFSVNIIQAAKLGLTESEWTMRFLETGENISSLAKEKGIKLEPEIRVTRMPWQYFLRDKGSFLFGIYRVWCETEDDFPKSDKLAMEQVKDRKIDPEGTGCFEHMHRRNVYKPKTWNARKSST